jgi:hypothetical protein
MKYLDNVKKIRFPKWFLNLGIDARKSYTMKDLVLITGKSRPTLILWLHVGKNCGAVELYKKEHNEKYYKFNRTRIEEMRAHA